MRELIAKLEAATGPDRELDWRIAEKFDIPDRWPASTQWPPFSPKSKYDKSIPTLTASIDAAVALAERVLPDAGWAVAVNRIDRRYVGRIWSGEIDDGKANAGSTPALALCIAILRAAEENASQEGAG